MYIHHSSTFNLRRCEEFAKAAVPPASSSESQPWRYMLIHCGATTRIVVLGLPTETRRSKRSKRWVTFPSSSSRCSKELWQCRHDTNRTSVTGESKRRMKGCQTLLHDLGVPKMKMYALMIYDRQARQETKSAEKCLCQPKPFRFLRTGRVLRFNPRYEQCLVHVACAAREPGRKKSLHRLPPMLAKSHRIIRVSPRESSHKRCFNCIF